MYKLQTMLDRMFYTFQNMFQDFYDPTLEEQWMKDNFLVDGEPVVLEITDTAGQVTDMDII